MLATTHWGTQGRRASDLPEMEVRNTHPKEFKRMTDGDQNCHKTSRRRMLAGVGVAGLAGFAGCGFGDDSVRATIPPITTVPPERTPTQGPTTTATFRPPTTGDRGTSTQPTTTEGMVEEPIWGLHVPPTASGRCPLQCSLPIQSV